MASNRADIQSVVLLTSEQVSQLLNEHPALLRQRRVQGTGPRYLKTGPRRIRCRLEDVLAWLNALPNGGKRGRGRPRKSLTPHLTVKDAE
jgi:hypothetical protein